MTIPGITTSVDPTLTSGATVRQKRRGEFDALSKAVQAGDIAGAQQALSVIRQDGPAAGGGTAPPPVSGADELESDFAALVAAVQSGDSGAAQGALATLQQAMAAHGAGRHHHHGARAGARDAAGGSPATSAPAAPNTTQDGDGDRETPGEVDHAPPASVGA